MSDNADIKTAMELTAAAKGSFLNEVGTLEIIIDGFLAHHFCKTARERKDFLMLIMPSSIVTFESKRVLFKKIIEQYYPVLKDEFPNYFAFLEKVRDRRNKFAHYPVDITPKGMETFKKGKISLIDNTKQRIEFDPIEIAEIINEISRLTKAIVAIFPK